MLIDARLETAKPRKSYDVCIIGAGAAGITMALELVDTGMSVCVLESGGTEFEDDTSDLSVGGITGQPYADLDVVRLRYLGGSTNHWGGWCRPFRDIEFENRDWVPHSGWPITRKSLDPYYRAAAEYCEIGTADYDVGGAAAAFKNPRIAEMPLSGSGLMSTIYRFSPPTRFGEVYRARLEKAKNVEVLLHANVLNMELSHDANRMESVRVGTLSGARFTVAARRFVLATGGLENARLLLLSRNVAKRGIGNQHDLVGRYFMEHPGIDIGLFVPSDGRSFDFYNTRIGYHDLGVCACLEVDADTQRQKRIMSARVQLTGFSAGESSAGAKSLKTVREQFRRGRWPDDFGTHLGNMVADIDDVAKAVYGYLQGDKSAAQYFGVQLSIEQEPNPDSRVSLSEKKDAFGLNRVDLDWRLTANDYRTVTEAAKTMATGLGIKDLGRMRLDIDRKGKEGWPEHLGWGWHQIGTTRMSDDPKLGVVDRHCRVHGVANLYVAGSSVFPTSGAGVPTLTIVALAVRLAEHLRRPIH
jgi:choline dehydrogenase-like flavoprotein